ncbi:MAG: hypothetical protein HGA78_08950 [Nitrospirales bacterium]|nr:hypothetical protein [Nitrospirales bacterium]
MPSALPRFAADAMLGGLAKWLRAVGFDTLYFRDITDRELVRLSRQEQRVLLTRDTGLVRRRQLPDFFLVGANDTVGQIREVLGHLISSGSFALPSVPRCMRCNGEVTGVERASVMSDVPEHVFLNTGSFSRCSGCGRVYWEGSHKKAMERMIRMMVEEAGGRWKDSIGD